MAKERRHKLIAGRYIRRGLVKRQGQWSCDIRDMETGIVRRKFARKLDDNGRPLKEREAIEEIEGWVEEVARRESAAENAPEGVPMAEAMEEFLALREPEVREISISNYRKMWRQLRPTFEGKNTDEVTFADVESWRAEQLKAGRAAITISIKVQFLRRFFRWAKRRKWAIEDPTEGIKLPKPGEAKGRALTVNEVRRLVAACDKERVVLFSRRPSRGKITRRSRPPAHLRLAVLVSVYTGLRVHNLLTLAWRHVDFEVQKLTISGEEMKSGRPHEIPLHPVLEGALHDERRYKREIHPGTRLFHVKRSGLTKSFRRVLKSAELPLIRWHDLRHSFATLMAARTNYLTLQSLLGHSPGSVTAIYTHPSLEERRKAIAQLPNFLEPPASPEGAEKAF